MCATAGLIVAHPHGGVQFGGVRLGGGWWVLLCWTSLVH